MEYGGVGTLGYKLSGTCSGIDLTLGSHTDLPVARKVPCCPAPIVGGQDPRLDIRKKGRPHTDLVQQIYIPFY